MLKGKLAIVTGSTSGIGLGIARRLAGAGADILLNGFGDAGEIEKVRAGLEGEFGVRAAYSAADMSRPEQVKGMVEEALERFGRVDVLVNNAGIQHTAPVEDFPGEKWEAILSINLSAAFYAIQAALPAMKRQKWGRVVNIASAHGLVASANKSAYVAAKHGLVGLTKVVALETATTPVTCNAICPGWVLTPLVQKQIEALAAKDGTSVGEAQTKLLTEKQPAPSFTTPEQLGDVALFLCSDGAANIRGAALSVDGGWTAQ